MTMLKKCILPACIIGISILTGCSTKNVPAHEIIHIEGVSWAFNVNTSYFNFGSITDSEEKSEVVLPVADGDLLYMMADIDDDFSCYYRYHSKDGTRLVATFDSLNTTTVYLNGVLEYVELSDQSSSWNLMSELSEPEIKQLSALHITSVPSEENLAILRQHESSLHGTALLLENDATPEQVNELLSICRPKWLSIYDPLLLPGRGEGNFMSDLEFLWIQGYQNTGTEVFQCCSNLESLIIDGWNPAEGELLRLSNLRKLHTLTLAECRIATLSSIDFPESLQRFYMVDCDSLSDIGGILNIPDLQALGLTGCDDLEGLTKIKDMKSLRWISFPSHISQSEFKTILSDVKSVEVIEMIGCPLIENLTPLQTLPDLKILALDMDDMENLSYLEELKQLDLIILNSELFDENMEWIDELQTNLPNTLIVPGSGLCLGSGWLLLLIPLVLISRYLLRFNS